MRKLVSYYPIESKQILKGQTSQGLHYSHNTGCCRFKSYLPFSRSFCAPFVIEAKSAPLASQSSLAMSKVASSLLMKKHLVSNAIQPAPPQMSVDAEYSGNNFHIYSCINNINNFQGGLT